MHVAFNQNAEQSTDKMTSTDLVKGLGSFQASELTLKNSFHLHQPKSFLQKTIDLECMVNSLIYQKLNYLKIVLMLF
jgi:hypothetical protein